VDGMRAAFFEGFAELVEVGRFEGAEIAIVGFDVDDIEFFADVRGKIFHVHGGEFWITFIVLWSVDDRAKGPNGNGDAGANVSWKFDVRRFGRCEGEPEVA